VKAGDLVSDRFEIDRQVAETAMSVVYRARDRVSGAPVALKLLRVGAAHLHSEERHERFAREVRLLADIVHPQVARHVDHGRLDDGRAYLAMEWLEGNDLAATLSHGALSAADSLRLMVSATQAVAAVHARGVIHRDLKPSNLFLRGGSVDDVVLLDFGVSRSLDSSTVLTGSAVVGTPHYMAPEQATSARAITPAADVFSLGCVFYECLTGRRPFEARQLYGVLARILYDHPEPLLETEALPSWSELIARMLDKQPGRRPPDGAAVLRALSALSPPVEAAAAHPLRTRAPDKADSSDQVLVCVVLALLPPGAKWESIRQTDRYDSIQSEMRRFGCPVEQLADGAFLATVLPQPTATDLVRIGARCAMYLREQLPGAAIAVVTGKAPLTGPRFGEAVDRAGARLEAAPAGDSIVLDGVTLGLLDGRFLTDTLDGVHVLIGERPEFDDSRPLLGKPTPCVGRELELIHLENLVTSVVEESAPKAAVVLGAPGIGKSRLRHELQRRLRQRHPHALVLTGFGDPLSAGSPYVLLSEALRRRAGIRTGEDPTRARTLIVEELARHVPGPARQWVSEFLGELAGVPFPADESPPLAAARGDHRVMSEQIALAFNAWLEAECAAGPVIVVLEDLQWGDALTVKLLEGALRQLSHAPLCVLAFGRPEVDDLFPRLLRDHRVLSLSLRGLSARASELLVTGVLGDQIDHEARERIVRLSAGNALYLEELIRAAAEGKAGEVPGTVLAILQARLSRLSPEMRLVLRAASIVGETFWQGAVARISADWGGTVDSDRWLGPLVQDELIAQVRTSRFPGTVEYAFRHALVCDAAQGLLTEPDRRSGHLAAARWLEQAGETDAIILARHAEEGGDGRSAITFYRRAAEQSVSQYDFAQALARAERGVALGASGEELGFLSAVKTIAFYNLGRWLEASRHGQDALALVPRGGVVWCLIAEVLLQVLPNTGELERSEAICDQLLQITPDPSARSAYLRAVALRLFGYSISGKRSRGLACSEFIERVGVSEKDLVARGYVDLCRSIFITLTGQDLPLALSLVERATGELEESGVKYRVTLCHIVRSLAWWVLGDTSRGEQAARVAKAMALQIHDDYHAALADWYLALCLSDHADPARLEEARGGAEALMRLQQSDLFEGTTLSLLARVAVKREEWSLAEERARRSRFLQRTIPPFMLVASAQLLEALTHLGRADEAAAVAREDLRALEEMGSPVWCEVMFRVAAAEAFHAAGDRDAADAVLRGALCEIARRAEIISDPSVRSGYLRGRPENLRAHALARAWSL